jgi:hypothetical protein
MEKFYFWGFYMMSFKGRSLMLRYLATNTDK